MTCVFCVRLISITDCCRRLWTGSDLRRFSRTRHWTGSSCSKTEETLIRLWYSLLQSAAYSCSVSHFYFRKTRNSEAEGEQPLKSKTLRWCFTTDEENPWHFLLKSLEEENASKMKLLPHCQGCRKHLWVIWKELESRRWLLRTGLRSWLNWSWISFFNSSLQTQTWASLGQKYFSSWL